MGAKISNGKVCIQSIDLYLGVFGMRSSSSCSGSKTFRSPPPPPTPLFPRYPDPPPVPFFNFAFPFLFNIGKLFTH